MSLISCYQGFIGHVLSARDYPLGMFPHPIPSSYSLPSFSESISLNSDTTHKSADNTCLMIFSDIYEHFMHWGKKHDSEVDSIIKPILLKRKLIKERLRDQHEATQKGILKPGFNTSKGHSYSNVFSLPTVYLPD